MARRRVRANGGGRPHENGPVEVKHVRFKPGWTREQVLDLLAQGYGDEAIAHRTGAPIAWVRKQSAPSTTLLEQVKQSGLQVVVR